MKKRRSAYLLEKLEPRLLFSADLALLPVDGAILAVDQDVVLVAPAQLSNDSEQIAEAVEQVQREVIFIDAGVEDYQQLFDDIQTQAAEGRQFETVLLDSNRDGITQISDYLSSQQDISAVHIISHGSNGEVVLGDSPLNLATLDSYAEYIEGWQQALTEEADLLFYGCNLASGEEGLSLISSLSLLTGADVAASDDATGQTVLGGDWELEYATGPIETSIAFSLDATQTWDQLLDDTVADNFTNIAYDGSDGTQPWSNDWQEINESDGAGAGNMQVYDRLSWGRGLYLWKDHVGAWREVDLSGAAAATLSFDVATSGLDAGDSVTLEISTDGGGTWDVIDTFDSNSGLQAASYDISSYIDSDTQIKFESTTFGDNDEFFVDNLQINFTTGLASTSEFLINTPDIGNPQETSAESRGSEQAVAVNSSGQYAAVWSSLNQDGSGWGVFAQRYNESGNPLGGEFQITETTSDNQLWARIAMDGTGNFTVTWTSENQDGTTSSVYARQFNSSGNPLGAEFRVNTENSGAQSNSSIAMAADGRFVVAWEGEGSSDTDGIYFRRFNADGSARDISDQLANSGNRGAETNAVASMNDSGEFAIAWEVTGEIYLRPFNDDGSAMWSESKINGFTISSVPAIAMGNDGKVTVVWRSENIIHDGIWLQIYDSADESLLPGAIQVDQNSVEDSTNPSISMDSAGNCIVVYEGSGDGDGLGVFGRIFDNNGNPQGSEFQINETTFGTQNMASVVMLDTDKYVAVWSGYGAADNSGVYARQFNTSTIALVNNDFWLTTVDDVSAGGQLLGTDTWENGDLLELADPSLTLGDITNGTLTSAFDIGIFSSGTNINGIHFVTSNIEIGPSNFQLESGDLLITTDSGTVDFTSASTEIVAGFTNSLLGVNNEDVVVFRPDSTGDYSSGLFSILFVDPLLGEDLQGISLVEQNTIVGDVTLQAGDFLFLRAGGPGTDRDVVLYKPNVSTFSVLLEGDDNNINIPKMLMGIDLVEATTIIGGQTLNSGTILLTVLEEGNVGSNDLPVTRSDIFAFEVSKTSVLGDNSVGEASASLFFDGSDIFFNPGEEDIDGFTLTGNEVNVAPVAIGDSYTVDEGSTTNLNLAGNDTDADDGLNLATISIVSGPVNGTIDAINTDGTVDYTHDGSETLTDSFTYTIDDLSGATSNAVTVPLTITPVNDAPTATNMGVTVLYVEDTPLDLTDITISDVDSPNVTATLTLSDTSAGALSVATSGSVTSTFVGGVWTASGAIADVNTLLSGVTFTPALNYDSVFSISTSVDDGVAAAITGVITVNSTPVNDTPTTSGITDVSVDEDAVDSVIDLFAAFADVEDLDPALTYTITANTNPGLFNSTTIDGVAGNLTLDYALNQNGSSDITIRATDSGNEFIETTFSVTVNPVNDTPTTSGITDVSVDEDAVDSVIDLFAAFADVEDLDPALTYTITANTNPGLFNSTTIDGVAGNLTLDYALNQNGSSDITIRATDSGNEFIETTFSVTVNPVNDTPTTSGITDVSVDEDAVDSVIDLFAAFADVEDLDPALTYTITANTNPGLFNSTTIDGVAGNLTLDYALNQNGSSDITIRATDSGNEFIETTFSVTVNPVNDTPTTSGIADVTVDEDAVDSVIDLFAAFADVEDLDPALTYTITANTNPGLFNSTTIDGVAGNLTLDYALNQNGSSDITIRATDSGNEFIETTFSVTVNPVNDTPTTSGIADVTVDEDAADSVIDLFAAFADVEDLDPALTYTITANTNPGLFNSTTIDGVAGNLTLDYALNQNGSSDITIRATDSGNEFIETTFSVTVNPVNDTPTFTSNAPTVVDEGSSYTYTMTVDDADLGDVLTLSAPTLPAWLNFNTTTGVLSGTPSNAEVGDHSVVLRVNDGTVDVDQSFTISVTNVNDAPTAITLDNLSVDEFSAGAIIGHLNTTDADIGDTHTYTVDDVRFEIVGDQLKLQAGQSLDHVAEPTVNVTVTSTDAGGLSTSQLFTITVNDINFAPTAVNDNLTAIEDHGLTITSMADLLVNDSDPDSDPLSLSSFTQPTHGNLVDHGDGTLTYTPDSNFSSTDSFNYTISDGNGGTASGTAFIYVTPVGDTPQVADSIVLAGSQSAPIIISRHTADGAEVTHFRISGINGGSLSLADGVTQVNNGDYISVTQGQAGLRFTPAADSVEGSFQVESSEDGLTVAAQSGQATSTIGVTALPPTVTPEVEVTPEIDEVEEEVVEEEMTEEEVVEDVTEVVDAPAETQLPLKEDANADSATGQTRSNNSLVNPILSFIQNLGSANENDSSLDAGQLSTLQTLNVLLETTPIETLRNVWDSLDIGTLSVRDYDLVRSSFDALQQEVKQEHKIENAVVSSAIATTMGLSAGYVVWMLKGGSLLASLLSSMPAWHLADPLSILGSGKLNDDDDESLESIIKEGEKKGEKEDDEE